MKNISMGHEVRLFALVSVCFVAACTPLKTFRGSDDNSEGGVPYVLPKSVMAVEVEVLRGNDKEFQDVRFTLKPKLVPDTDSGIYYLSSKHNSLFQTDHNITVRNGLLASVNTVDTGVSGDVFLSLVNSGINLYKYNQASAFAQSETQNPLLTASPTPTPAEIEYVLGLILGDKMAFNYFSDTGPPLDEALPGTAGILRLKSSVISPPALQ